MAVPTHGGVADVGGINDIEAFDGNEVAAVPVSFALASIGGRRRIRGTGSATDIMCSGFALGTTWKWAIFTFRAVRGGAIAGKNDFWAAVDSNITGIRLAIEEVDATTYNLALRRKTVGSWNELATGGTAFDYGTDYVIQLERNGSTIKVYVDSHASAEISVSESDDFTQYCYVSPTDADATFYWDRCCFVGSSAEADRPGFIIRPATIYPDSDGAVVQWGGQHSGGAVLCTDTARGEADHVDDWVANGTNDGDTEFNCGDANSDVKELHILDTVTIDTTLEIVGVSTYNFIRSNTEPKLNNNWTLLRDVNNVEIESQNIDPSVAYVSALEHFNAPPDGGSWDDFVSGTTFNHASGADSPLEMGLRVDADNGAHTYCTAGALTVLSLNLDPPAVTTVAPHVYHQRHHNRSL